jgi:phosphoglycolate phosphatase
MIEVIRRGPRARPRAALFDFDGTLSLMRSGWQRIMQRMMVEVLRQLPGDEAPALVEQHVARAIEQSTGQATIEQMAWLCAEVERRGGQPDSAVSYKRRYQAQLDLEVVGRYDQLRRGELGADGLLVPGSRGLLEELRGRGVLLLLASGTDLANVLQDATALGIAQYFGAHIYAPGSRSPDFSKRAVIAHLLAEEGLSGPELVAFGDGPVEIVETRAVGGLAVGVAFDEELRAGVDPRKRAMLIRAGADMIVPDFSERTGLLDELFQAEDTHALPNI